MKSKISNKQLLKKITKFIEKEVRPFLQSDGGDIEIHGLTEDRLVQVSLKGACTSCSSSTMTLEWGTQEKIDMEFNEPLELDPPIIIERIDEEDIMI